MGALCQQTGQHQDISDRSLDCLVMDTGNPAPSAVNAKVCQELKLGTTSNLLFCELFWMKK